MIAGAGVQAEGGWLFLPDHRGDMGPAESAVSKWNDAWRSRRSSHRLRRNSPNCIWAQRNSLPLNVQVGYSTSATVSWFSPEPRRWRCANSRDCLSRSPPRKPGRRWASRRVAIPLLEHLDARLDRADRFGHRQIADLPLEDHSYDPPRSTGLGRVARDDHRRSVVSSTSATKTPPSSSIATPLVSTSSWTPTWVRVDAGWK